MSNPKLQNSKSLDANVIDNESEVDNNELYNKDRAHLLQIFPDEIWQIITEAKNVDFTTLTNLSNCSPYFRKLLWSKRVLYLFPKVWPLIWPMWPISKKFYKNLLAGNQVLPLRLVCKGWCTVINQFQENLHSHFKMKHDHQPEQTTREDTYRFSTVVRVFDLESINQFLTHFKATHAKNGKTVNPFMGRAIAISNLAPDTQFEQLIKVWLGLYGKHVWYCSISSVRLDSYNMFREYLELMPNLRCLRVEHHYSGNDASGVINSYAKNLEAKVGKPFPVLSNLQSFSANHLLDSILHRFIGSQNQMKILAVGKRNKFDNSSSKLPELPGLEQLSLKCYSVQEYQILQTKLNSCKLTKLHLDLEKSQYVDWNELFTTLETNWAETLTDLMLSFAVTENTQEQKKILHEYSCCPLKLPLVSRLKLILRHVCCLDFILPMEKNLQFLSISVLWDPLDAQNQSLAREGEQMQRIKFLCSSENLDLTSKPMYDSNVWTLFPKLGYYEKICLVSSHLSRMCSCHGIKRQEWIKHNQTMSMS